MKITKLIGKKITYKHRGKEICVKVIGPDKNDMKLEIQNIGEIDHGTTIYVPLVYLEDNDFSEVK